MDMLRQRESYVSWGVCVYVQLPVILLVAFSMCLISLLLPGGLCLHSASCSVCCTQS
jgi:hypothetical protein